MKIFRPPCALFWRENPHGRRIRGTASGDTPRETLRMRCKADNTNARSCGRKTLVQAFFFTNTYKPVPFGAWSTTTLPPYRLTGIHHGCVQELVRLAEVRLSLMVHRRTSAQRLEIRHLITLCVQQRSEASPAHGVRFSRLLEDFVRQMTE